MADQKSICADWLNASSIEKCNCVISSLIDARRKSRISENEFMRTQLVIYKVFSERDDEAQ